MHGLILARRNSTACDGVSADRVSLRGRSGIGRMPHQGARPGLEVGAHPGQDRVRALPISATSSTRLLR